MPLLPMIWLKMPTVWCLNLNSLDNIFKKKMRSSLHLLHEISRFRIRKEEIHLPATKNSYTLFVELIYFIYFFK